MKKVCVAISVYSRINDLECLVQIINRTWHENDYDIYVISNGGVDGYYVPNNIKKIVYKVVDIPNNLGHQSGSSQLLLAFWDNVNFSLYSYCVIIEADTWLYGDSIITKYISLLDCDAKKVYAAAKWYDKYFSLATDFAIIKCSFLSEHRKLFEFNDKAECHMANYILEHNLCYTYIKENMLPHLPSYIKYYPYSNGGRFTCFPFSKMITHHVEQLNGGLLEKQRLFNVVSESCFFNVYNNLFMSYIENYIIKLFFLLSKILLRKTWYSKTIKLNE